MRMTKATARLIERERVCRVATAGGRGMPHLVPVCQALGGGKIYFASGNDGRKAHLKGVMVQGRARLIPRVAQLDESGCVVVGVTAMRVFAWGRKWMPGGRGMAGSCSSLGRGLRWRAGG